MSDAKTKWTTARVGANFVSHPSDARPGDFLIMELTQTSHRIESVTYRLNGQTLLEAAGLEPRPVQREPHRLGAPGGGRDPGTRLAAAGRRAGARSTPRPAEERRARSG